MGTNICFDEEYIKKLSQFLISRGNLPVGKNHPLSVLSNYSAKRIFAPPFIRCAQNSVNLSSYFPTIASRIDPVNGKLIEASGIYSLEYYVGSYFLAINSFNISLTDYYKVNPKVYQQIYNPFPENVKNFNTINPVYTIVKVNSSCENVRTSYDHNSIYTYYHNSKNGCITTPVNTNLKYNPPSISDNNEFQICSCNEFDCSIGTVNCFPFLPNKDLGHIFVRDFNGSVPFPEFNLNSICNYLKNGNPIYVTLELQNSFYSKYITNNNLNNYYPYLKPEGILYADNSGDSGNDEGVILCGYIFDVPAAKLIDGSSGVFIFIETRGNSFGNNGLFYMTFNYFFNVGNTNTALINNSSPIKQVELPFINTK